MSRIDQSSWQPFHAETVTNRFNQEVKAVLAQKSDRLLIRVTATETNADWVRAGYVSQYWQRGTDLVKLGYSKRLLLSVYNDFEVEPLEQSLILFTPVGWLYNWSIAMEARIIE